MGTFEETVSVVTVSYQNAESVKNLLTSVCDISSIDRICVVNNYPSEKIDTSLYDTRGVDVIERRNEGYSRGVNAGILETDSRYILLLNPDVEYISGDIQKAVERLRSDDEIAVIAPKVLNPDGSVQHSVRRFYTLKTVLYARAPWRNDARLPDFFRAYLMDDFDHQSETTVDWALGCALLIDRCKLDGPEVFDPRYFLYFEDVDLCYNCWRRGKKVTYYPHLVFCHAHRRASSKNVRFLLYHIISFFKFVIKCRGLPRRPVGYR
jgi:hypothetical protein